MMSVSPPVHSLFNTTSAIPALLAFSHSAFIEGNALLERILCFMATIAKHHHRYVNLRSQKTTMIFTAIESVSPPAGSFSAACTCTMYIFALSVLQWTGAYFLEFRFLLCRRITLRRYDNLVGHLSWVLQLVFCNSAAELPFGKAWTGQTCTLNEPFCKRAPNDEMGGESVPI